MKKDYVRMLAQIAKSSFYFFFYPVVQLFTKQIDNEVLFLSDSREDFSGNFAFVKEEIEKRKKYNIVGIFKKNLKVKRTLKEKIYLLKCISRAKYIFVDDFYPNIYVLKLKKSKSLIQLWHAMGAYKTVGYARLGKPGGPKGLTFTHRNYTGCIVSGKGVIKNYATAFGISEEKVHALGIPRTDIFFDKKYKKKIINDLHKKYPILKNKKIILFAPTFRGNGQNTAYYNYDWIDFERIKKEFEKEYVCIIKMHPFIKNKPSISFKDDDFYLDLSDEREINDLLFITDLLITDYSSVIYEYSFFKKPIIFYTPDFDEYIASRDFFYNFDKYNYGVRVDNIDDLIKAIKKGEFDKKIIDNFYEYFCSACDGNSTKKVVDYFLGE